jgi:hypothetical protein
MAEAAMVADHRLLPRRLGAFHHLTVIHRWG